MAGKRVLDLGCNAGYWSLCAIENGCGFVLGIEGRHEYIDQANFVFKVKGIERERYEFRCGNAVEVLNEGIGRFDIVLCFRLLCHTCKNVEMIGWIGRINEDGLVIDTSLSLRETPGRD